MGLAEYRRKRSFDKTTEPKGGKADSEALRFVIQKHAASHLHYDFRLEMEGVLKSWAVPKGPSLDPEVKRLAMMVEDHPYDYRDFEGIIPQGQYGGGTVIVWDEGTYEPIGATGKSKKEQERALLRDLHLGRLKFTMKGKKLKGTFALVKASGRGENSWLLMKVKDKYATTDDITLKNRSVISRLTLEQVAATSTNIYGRKAKKQAARPKEKQPEQAKVPKPKVTKPKKHSAAITAILKKAPDADFPQSANPMLATLIKSFKDTGDWSFEVKWDGYRALAMMNGEEVELRSRNNKSFNKKFYPVYEAVTNWGINAVVDGEIVVLNEHGVSHFSSLQNWRSEADGELVFYVFDVLWLDGKDLCPLPLKDRQQVLHSLMPKESDIIRLSENFKTKGEDFMELASKFGLEGIMAKKEDSPYRPGERSNEWQKIKLNKRQEVVIGGFTRNEDTRKPFSSLLVGTFEDGVFQYTGKVGTGFTDKMQEEMMQQFKPLIISSSPFDSTPDVNKPSRFRPNPPKAKATWLKPELVCAVNYTEITSDGVMRHPAFAGMCGRKATEVVREKEAPLAATKKEQSRLAKKGVIVPPGKKNRGDLVNPNEASQTRKLNGHDIKFSNLDKLYWPDEGISKRDLINYYYQIAPFILPYLKGRPMSLNRHPNGINGTSFYQKDIRGKAPDWIENQPYKSSDDPTPKAFLVCTDEASLLYMASMGCIEMNPWSSTVEHPDNPDWCIIDLDPAKNSFEQVIEAAQVTHQILEALSIPSYCKTSGSTGLHIYIPLGAQYTYEQSKELGRAIATLVQHQLPKFTSIERIVSRRRGKMYIDFLQNRPQATLAAPYSLRPKPGATVSMPLHWDEVKPGLKMKDFTIFNAVDRAREVGDIFKPVLGKGINLARVIRSLEAY
jgi:bifunctional non-homologous end joining protein LigD